jgi:hypothetical protein
LELLLRPVHLDRFGRIKLGEMLADDFLRAVALDALGAGVPGRYPTARIEHEDRVVLDAFDKAPERIVVRALLFRGVSHAGSYAPSECAPS